jgi:cell division protease FtsH
LVLGNVSTGTESDLKEATKLALKMVANYGMSKSLGPVYYEHEAEHPFLGQHIATDGASDVTLHNSECEARGMLAAALAAASATLSAHRAELTSLEQALLERETFETSDLQVLWQQSERHG